MQKITLSLSNLDCGQYCFTTTFEGEDEKEVPVIEIQHQPPRKHISLLSTGLCFMESSLIWKLKSLSPKILDSLSMWFILFVCLKVMVTTLRLRG